MRHCLQTIRIVAVLLVLSFTLSALATADDVLVVHYKRHTGDYDGWTLWTWDAASGQASQELERTGEDDFGLVFELTRADYGDGTQMGLLPKYMEWESKDPPDRIWTADMGDEVWILSGLPQLFTEQPGEEAMGTDTGDMLTVGMVFKVERKNYGGTGMQIGVLPKFGDWASKDAPDRIWFPHMGEEVWILAGNEELFSEVPDTTPWIAGAFIDAVRTITVSLSTGADPGALKPDKVVLEDSVGEKVGITDVKMLPPKHGAAHLVAVTVDRDFDVRGGALADYTISIEGFKSAGLSVRGIMDTPEYYSEEEMGAVYSPEETVFRVFAPTATSVRLSIHDVPEGGEPDVKEMTYTDKGIWELTVAGDLNGKYYTLRADGPDPRFADVKRDVIDPYSRCNTAHNGRGMVIKDETPVEPAPVFDRSEVIIYELHIRDFTISSNSGITNKGMYLGFTETGTTMPEHPEIFTGIDHLEELGVNTIQIMPIQDFENDESSDQYNWGYMPVHFNSPDGWFATRTGDATRVKEFKLLVDALHKKGMKVIMDVVYNHTAEYRPQRIYSFEGLVPGYYYRMREDGSYYNGSGTGNETRSEAPMMRKFIVESCKYWVEEYDVDGFRFDLMGLHDLATMVEIVETCREIKPDIVIHGEPWTGGETPIMPTGKGAQKGKGFASSGASKAASTTSPTAPLKP